MKRRRRKSIFAWFLSTVMMMTMFLAPVYANDAQGSGLCEHHSEHTAECGFVAEVPGVPCQHVHTDECYSLTESCGHIHTDACYGFIDLEAEDKTENTETEVTPEENLEDDIEKNEDDVVDATKDDAVDNSEEEKETVSSLVPSETEESQDNDTELVETPIDMNEVELDVPENQNEPDALGAAIAENEAIACEHMCSEESGCIIKTLDCPHERNEHDESCGYSAGQAGSPCQFVCDVCMPKECNCTVLCTEDERNMECPVCGAEEEELSLCKGIPLMYPMAMPKGSYEAFDAAETNENGIFEFRIRPAGSTEEGVLGYCFNYHLLNPDMFEMGVVGPYTKLSDVSNETFSEYAQGEWNPETLKQDVLNVVWNGYPYYGGDWKGVASGEPYKKQLLDIYYTQSAVWHYTDSLAVADESLIESAKNNPAPANFVLDLYDGTKAEGAGLNKHPEYGHYQNLLGVRLEKEDLGRKVTVKVNKIWQNADGKDYVGETPSVSFELYEGSISEGEEPLQTINLPDGAKEVSFSLLDDGQEYTLREVMTGQTKHFKADSDKVIRLAESQDEINLTFTNIYQPKGGFRVEKNVVGNAENPLLSYHFLVKLRNGDGTAYEGEYTIEEAEGKAVTNEYETAGISFTLKDGESCLIGEIPEGIIYTIQEERIPQGYELHNIKKDGVVQEGATTAEGVLDGERTPLFTFVNNLIPEPDTVPLIIQKNVVGAPEGTKHPVFSLKVELFDNENDTPYTGEYTLNGSSIKQSYDFENGISLQLGDGEYAMIGGLKPTTAYRITEVAAEGYEPAEKVVEGVLDESGTWLDYVNQYVEKQNRTLKLEKLVKGTDTDAAFEFEVTVSGDQVTYSPETYVTPLGGTTYKVVLKNGESVTFSGMPEGYSYLIKEKNLKHDDVEVKQIQIDASKNALVNEAKGTVTEGDVQDEQVHILYTNTVAPVEDPPKSGGGNDPWDAEVRLTAEKELDGKKPKDGMFTFVLKDADGKVIQTKKNDGRDVIFDTLFFREEGTYHYTISEKAGDDKGIRYDNAVYAVEIRVTESLDYEAEVSYQKDGRDYTGTPLFENKTREQPQKDKTSVTVQKRWAGDVVENRPDEARVQLYRNGVAYGDVMVLNAQNGWEYTWKNLDKNAVWTVDEILIPDGYQMTSDQEENVWTLTNTWNPPTDPNDPDEPNDPDKPDEPDDPKESNGSNDPGEPNDPDEKNVTENEPEQPERSLDSNTPKTDDTSSVNQWVTMTLISFAGMVITAVLGMRAHRKKTNKS